MHCAWRNDWAWPWPGMTASRGDALGAVCRRSKSRRDGGVLAARSAPGRLQCAIAHEVGELLAETVFAKLLIDPSIAPAHCRETIANGSASRLLLPSDLFSADAISCGWDLLELKNRYATASHELIARRMLDFPPPVIITVFDNNCLTWLRTNLPCRAPKLGRRELPFRNAVHESNGHRFDPGPPPISAWAIHEPG